MIDVFDKVWTMYDNKAVELSVYKCESVSEFDEGAESFSKNKKIRRTYTLVDPTLINNEAEDNLLATSILIDGSDIYTSKIELLESL